MKFRITLFVIISGIFIPINSVNANSTDRDDYNFYKGSFSSVCAGYVMDFISEKNASMMFNALVDMGNETIIDSNTKKRFNYFIKNSETFIKECPKLVK